MLMVSALGKKMSAMNSSMRCMMQVFNIMSGPLTMRRQPAVSKSGVPSRSQAMFLSLSESMSSKGLREKIPKLPIGDLRLPGFRPGRLRVQYISMVCAKRSSLGRRSGRPELTAQGVRPFVALGTAGAKPHGFARSVSRPAPDRHPHGHPRCGARASGRCAPRLRAWRGAVTGSNTGSQRTVDCGGVSVCAAKGCYESTGAVIADQGGDLADWTDAIM